MREPLELEDITGLSLSIIGTLVETYVKEGYADPTMYRALRAGAELAEHFKARLEHNGVESAELMAGVTQLIDDLRVTAIECGEVVNHIIDEHGLPISKDEWSNPVSCDHDHTDGEDGK